MTVGQHLIAEANKVEKKLAVARPSVCRGGHRLAKQRDNLGKAGITEEQWRNRWHAARWFVTADGDAEYPLGNGTIQVHPDQQWLELRLPGPLEHLANRPRGRYRLANPVHFSHREDEWAAQATSGAVRYDISLDTAKGRWYLDASWRIGSVCVPSLDELRQQRALSVDLNADHLACWTLDGNGNPIGRPHTIPLKLDGLPVRTRDGRLRSAVADLMRVTVSSGCNSTVVEDLDFADARQMGREALGRGRGGKRLRRVIAGIPGWTSRWGRRYWQTPLNQATKHSVTVTRHHAAAVVIARRGLGLGARRRPGVPGHDDRRIVIGELPARPDHQRPGREGTRPPGGQGAAAAPRKTRLAKRIRAGDQMVQNRSGPSGGPPPALRQGTVG